MAIYIDMSIKISFNWSNDYMNILFDLKLTALGAMIWEVNKHLYLSPSMSSSIFVQQVEGILTAGVGLFIARTIAESKKKHEEKQLKAQQLRDKLKEEKNHKLQKLLERVSLK